MAPSTNNPQPTLTDRRDDVRSALVGKRRQLVDSLGGELVTDAGLLAGSRGETEHLSASEQRDMSVAIGSMQRKALVEVEAALARLDAGTYGTCEGCGLSIPPERLEAIPEAAVCVRCG